MIIVQIAGHLGQDPETRFTPTNKKVTTLRVATNLKRGNKEKTVWWRVTLWGDRFDQKVQYLKKGSAIMVIGEMGIPDIYTDKDGNPQTSFEVVADSLLFNPFGGKASDKSTAKEEMDSGEEYAVASSKSSSTQGLKKGGLVHGMGQKEAFFDGEDDIPF